MPAEAFEPNRGIEAFDVGIVGWLAWAAEVQRNAVRRNSKPKSPPYRGAIIEVRRQDKMRLASRLVPPPHAAHPSRRLHPALRSRGGKFETEKSPHRGP